jgi:hypothetical protein
MAQFDIIFSQNIASSGIDFSEKTLAKAASLGYFITQDPTTGVLSWTKTLSSPVINGAVSGTSFVTDFSSAPAAGLIPDALSIYNKVIGIVSATDAMVYKGPLPCAGDPNYPVASKGWTYKVTSAGHIGGASGPAVEIGDTVICETNSGSGIHSAVGANFNIIQGNVDGGVFDARITGTTGILRRGGSAGSYTYSAGTISSTDVGLGNANNTADADKPISTAGAAALALKAPLASPTFTGTVSGVTATMVGLGSVNNTADSAKPVSTAQQSALDLKAPVASPAFTGTVTGITKAMIGLGSVDNTADASKPVSTAQASAIGLKADIASPTFTGTVSGITKSMVGLTNVDNTTDALKPVSTAQAAAIGLKADIASPTFTGTVGGITKTMVGLPNVDNTADSAKPVSTAQAAAIALKANLASPTFTGTVAGIDKAMVGLSNVDNTTDAAKPISSAQATAIGLKADIASPSFTGTVNGISKSMVGLGSVDNTSDASKPVSSAQATAIAAKLDASVYNAFISTAVSKAGTAPGTVSATGTVGQMFPDANYLYVCTAVNTWKRIPLASF